MDTIRSYIPIVGIIAFLAGLYLTGDALWTYATYDSVEATVSSVDDHVTERRGRRGRRIREVGVEISYPVNGEVVAIRKMYSEGDAPREGSKIPMRYNASHPEKAVVDQPAKDFSLGLGSFVVGVVFVFLTFRGWGSD